MIGGLEIEATRFGAVAGDPKPVAPPQADGTK
jgi:hypothetical protein